MTLIQTEPKAIKIGIPRDDYSAMQGPCDTGFHIPTQSEWVALCGVLTNTFQFTYTSIVEYLKLPLAGRRIYSDSAVSNQGSRGLYREAEKSSARGGRSLLIRTDTTPEYQVRPDYSDYASIGASIRGFKDTTVIPDSSWTTLYDGSSIATGAGIFHNSTLGLISISGDGATWYTISDKNLGATTVYNSGDTLSEANCGKYFQFGNNYGFAWTGSITTSSTKVDATGYGPGNYYSSSTFIKGGDYRDSSNNANLRGGVTGVVQKADTDIKKVYLGSTLVRPSGWQPGANTLLYLPLDSTNTYADLSSYHRNITNTNVRFGTYTSANVSCAYFGVSRSSINITSFVIPAQSTISLRMYQTQLPTGWDGKVFMFYNGDGITLSPMGENPSEPAYDKQILYGDGAAWDLIKNTGINPTGRWLYINITRDNGTITLKVLGDNLTYSDTQSGGATSFTPTNMYLGNSISAYPRQYYGHISKFIIENKIWTETEKSDYYDQTKGDYGIS